MSNHEWIGWACSVVLIFTIFAQVRKEWNTPRPKGVSQWLYYGQIAAEAGFVYYSWLVQNWVFVVTNAIMLLLNIAGIVVHSRKTKP
jgi:MtN3 and saliva related transmembrane protein